MIAGRRKRPSAKVILNFWLLVLAISLVLFFEHLVSSAFVSLRTSAGTVAAFCCHPSTQWIAVLCLACCFAVLLIFERRTSPSPSHFRLGNPALWLALLVLLTLLPYAIRYEDASKNAHVAVFLAAVIFGKSIIPLLKQFRRNVPSSIETTVTILAALLAIGTFWRTSSFVNFQYHGLSRWTGLWDDPNIFGVLMGSATILAVGLLAFNIQFQTSTVPWEKIPRATLYALIAIACGYGLLKSYSRGAWVGTAVAFAYLIPKVVNFQFASSGPARKDLLLLPIILIAVGILAFWQFRFSEWRPIQRIVSTTNINDFSWRNRVRAWEGAIQMMADRPALGFGWNRAESVYEQNYCPPQLGNGAAIQMNDYLMLGISAGVPALFCFVMYVGLSLRGSGARCQVSGKVAELGMRNPERGSSDLEWVQTVCRAGAIVLLVGFWFDGGLFKLATGSVFWILLELGKVDFQRRSAEPQRAALTKTQNMECAMQQREVSHVLSSEKKGAWLRWCAGILGSLVLLQTIVLLGTPYLQINNGTLVVAQRWLVPPKAVADLNYLATNASWNGVKLKTLLQHASLANYNRELINWKLGDQIYREYVLAPAIDRERDGRLNWRRSLWEYFYQPVRKQTDQAAAVKIVMKYLRERLAIVPEGPLTIEEMWDQKKADLKGFEALKVAAFRSVGIPARLNDNGQAELFANGKWQSGG